MHGELGSLGVLIMSALQGNRPELRPRDRASARASATAPTSWASPGRRSTRPCEALPAFVAREGLWYSIANDLVYGEREAAIVREALDF